MKRKRALLLAGVMAAASIALVTVTEGQTRAPKFDLETPVVATQDDTLLVAVPLKNVGGATATNVTVRQILAGPGTLQKPALPLALGNIAAGGDVLLQLAFTNVARNGQPPLIVQGSFSFAGRTQSFQANVALPQPQSNDGTSDSTESDIPPQTTDGTVYPPAPPHSPEDANDEDHDFPLPEGKLIGDLQPHNESTDLPGTETPALGRIHPMAANDPVTTYRSGTLPVQNNPSSFFPWDPSGASVDLSDGIERVGARLVFLTGNTYVLMSTDGGSSFTKLDPTTFFSTNFDGGLCCDQVVQYIPSINRVVWLMQFWPVQLYDANGHPLYDGNGKPLKGRNRIRIAAASPAQVVASGGKSWTYWDMTSYGTFNAGNAWMDYPDMSYSDNALHISIDMQGSGLFVIRALLSEIQSGSTLHLRYTDPANGTTAFGSHLTQDSPDAAYWFGQVSTSSIRVFEWMDSSNSYSWRTLNVNSWLNSDYQTLAPNGVDWLSFGFARTAIRGATVQYPSLNVGAINERLIRIAWSAARGGGFPQPYVRILTVVKASLAGLTVWGAGSDREIWNSNFAFQHPYMSTNADGEVGIDTAYGGPSAYPTPLVGFVGDHTMYYLNKSTTAIGRWGDYSAIRKHPNDPKLFSISDYFLQAPNSDHPSGTVIHQYRLFGRSSAVGGIN